ncbi:MAG TPA: ATP-binding protein [Galbitalea sp.]|jgi:signal transduction histidine kinase|nr:ATP-binding protein [Galbitalea sp.]
MSLSQRSGDAPNLKFARNPVSRKQIEIVLSRSVAAGSLVFAAQTAAPLFAQLKENNPIWTATIVIALVASLVAALICSIAVRFVRISHGLVALVYVAALVTWPFDVVTPHSPAESQWLYFLVNVGTSTATIAFSTRWAAIYLFVVPSIYGIVRMTPPGGSEPVPQAVLDSVYSIILGGAVVVLITMLRQTATNVDLAQSAALERYSHAVRHHATEVERVQVDSIVHDSVLTTLISAARAYTPEAKKLGAVMAGNAIGYLRDAAMVQPDDGSTVRLRATAQRVADAAAEMAHPFKVTNNEVGPRSVPVSVGEAIASAAQQAMINSVQHAGDGARIKRWVTIRGVRPGGIEVEIGDNGAGFAAEAVPTERLGVRVSIIERVANAGGVARIASSPGHGTIVSLRWPVPKSASAASDEEAALTTTQATQTGTGS